MLYKIKQEYIDLISTKHHRDEITGALGYKYETVYKAIRDNKPNGPLLHYAALAVIAALAGEAIEELIEPILPPPADFEKVVKDSRKSKIRKV